SAISSVTTATIRSCSGCCTPGIRPAARRRLAITRSNVSLTALPTAKRIALNANSHGANNEKSAIGTATAALGPRATAQQGQTTGQGGFARTADGVAAAVDADGGRPLLRRGALRA